MAATTCIKYPLCVEWTTKLPFEGEPSKSSNFSLWGSLWFFEFRRVYSDDILLSLCDINSERQSLVPPESVTISVSDGGSRASRVVTDETFVRKSGDSFWTRGLEKLLREIPNILKSGKLKISCVFNGIETGIDEAFVIESASPIRYSTASSLQTLSTDISAFLKDETLSDVKLICERRVFNAHWLVLAARSEFFQAMSRDKSKRETGIVYIKNLDPDVLELVLQFMYTGKRPELNADTARRLYVAADNYLVHDLKEACSVWMMESQSPENFLDFLVLADKRNDADFKEAMTCLLARKLTSLSAKTWSTFKEKYPKLAILVLEKFLPAPMTNVPENAGK